MLDMVHKSFKKEIGSIEQRFIERRRLLMPFIRRYGNPVLVHAIDKKAVFKKIIEGGKLKLPKTHSSPKKTPLMERMLNIDNGIYYSMGFVYFTSYGWNYNLIFDINYLQDLVYYSNSAIYQCYRAVIDYWYDKDRQYLEKLANINKQTREVVDKYYNVEFNGEKRTLFDFWKIEKYVFGFINKYPNHKKIKNIIGKVEKKFIKNFPSSLRDAKKAYLTFRTPEIIGLKENNLLKNKHFLGFYINGSIQKDILAILKKKYSDKILFDGTKIKKISNL